MLSYKQVFSQNDKSALIPFFVIGDPDYQTSLEIVKTAIDSGADILELGIPFSDPIADGPTIQNADIRAMEAGMDVTRALEFIKEVKQYKDIPIGLLMYYNLIYKYGQRKFFMEFYEAGVNSVLIADLNIDDAGEILPDIKEAGLDTVFMATPITETARMKKIAAESTGFIYTVSLLGVTGSRNSLSGAVKPLIQKLKSITDTPVCVGFGISSPEHAIEVSQAGADGVIIGSRMVRMIEENLGNKSAMLDEISNFIKEIKDNLNKVEKISA